MHFVNVTDHAPAVAPFAGADARYVTNPVCIAVPGTEATPPVVLDMATSKIAAGKVRVAMNKGEALAPDTLIDSAGKPTTDPAAFYTRPRGALLTIGAHTRTHPLLTSVSRDEAWTEIAGAKEELERELGHPVDAFAYPYGGNGLSVRRMVERAGFRWAFTTEPRIVTDARRMRRLRVPRVDMRAALADVPEGRPA